MSAVPAAKASSIYTIVVASSYIRIGESMSSPLLFTLQAVFNCFFSLYFIISHHLSPSFFYALFNTKYIYIYILFIYLKKKKSKIENPLKKV